MRKLLLVLLLCPLAHATVYTTTSTGGSCASGASFVGGVAPNTAGGDRVIIANGATLDVPVSTVCHLGDYPTDNTGNVALQGASTTGTGILTVEGQFIWSGPVRQPNANWIVSAGATITYDATAAPTPATALYTWQISQANNQAAVLKFNGSSGAHVTVNALSNINSGGFGQSSFNDGGLIQATYTDFSYQGPPTASGVAFTFHPINAVTMSFANCTFDHSGGIGAGQTLGAASNFIFTQNLVTNPFNLLKTIYIDGTQASTITGTRLVSFNVLHGETFLAETTTSGQTGFVYKFNAFVNNTGTNAPIFVTQKGAFVASFNENLFSGGVETATLPAGTNTRTSLFRAADPGSCGGCLNNHPFFINIAGSFNTTMSNCVFDSDNHSSDGDAIQITVTGSPTGKLEVSNCIYNPNSVGGAIGSTFNDTVTSVPTTFTMAFLHNLVAGSACGAGVCGVGGEQSNIPANTITVANNSIYKTGTAAAAQLVQSNSNATIANGATPVADYNNVYNITGTVYSTPLNQYVGTPGVHDFAVNPGFVDPTRNFFTFDTAYLGNPTATAWVNGGTYAVGDRVSASTSGFFNGATYNYCAIVANTGATATNKPGAGSGWSEVWVPASECDIEADILAGNTYNGGTVSMIGLEEDWVRAGYHFTNATLHNAGSDGLDIGPINFYDPPPPPTSTVTVSGSVKFSGPVVIQ